MELLALVPARAGSKGVPGKNKALIGGLPLIDYTLSALEASACTTGIIVTTDDRDILMRYQDRESVFLVERPAYLSTDEATSADAVAHALSAWTSAGRGAPSVILLAQPTSPLRTAADIDNSFSLFRKSRTESLISCCAAEGMRHPMDMYRMDSTGKGVPFLEEGRHMHRRDSYESLYQRNGAIYMVTAEYFHRTGRLRSETPVIYEMPWERSINIDTPGDFLIAKAIIESGLLAARPAQ